MTPTAIGLVLLCLLLTATTSLVAAIKARWLLGEARFDAAMWKARYEELARARRGGK